MILPGERLDDLQYQGLKILQKTEGFRFGTDALLLADFARIPCPLRGLDMGSGTGVIALLLAARNPESHFTALEIQPDMADMARRSVEMNGLSDRLDVVQGDLRQAAELLGRCTYDLVVMNPPYCPLGTGPASPSETKAMARHSVTCSAQDMARAAFTVLRNGGRFCAIYPADRIQELMDACSDNRLEPKRLRMVQHRVECAPKRLLLEAVREGKKGINWEAPLILYQEDGTYTPEAHAIYYREEKK